MTQAMVTSGARTAPVQAINASEDIRAFPLPRPDREHVDRHDSIHQEQCDQGLGEHYMNPKITAPQNKNARAVAKTASLP
jgi:hypothetical protein